MLKIFKKHKNINTSNLPIDSRSLLATPKSTGSKIVAVNPGKYFHFGLESGLLRYTSSMDEIKVAIGIDGLPLSKSSSSQFWPILAYVIGPVPRKVFPVGIYHGYEKPHDSDMFLAEFVKEAKHLVNNGIKINDDISKKVIIHVFCCDAPARAFVLKIKSHSGFFSCARCTVEGEYYKNRVCFPYTKTEITKRTYEAYKNLVFEDHHTSTTPSSLIEIPNLNVVSSFSLDYMHLTLLGVTRKLILLWLSKGSVDVRLSSSSVEKISKSLLKIKQYITSDFVRKTRPINEINRWKATELRIFLLYIGPVVLKNVLNDDVYINFMSLSVAMIILVSPDHSDLVYYADELLNYFVESFEKLYGSEHVSFNVHGLLHLSDDYRKFGPLDNCSAFPFENFMKELKSKVRKHDQCLEQVINRYSEIQKNINMKEYIQESEFPKLEHSHKNGPEYENSSGFQYKCLKLEKFKIDVGNEKDCYILSKQEEVVKCVNIISISNDIIIIGKVFDTILPYFNKPADSSLFSIFSVKNLSNSLKYWKLTDIKKKMMVILHADEMIAMPLIHTES